jgi:hypothetical protein
MSRRPSQWQAGRTGSGKSSLRLHLVAILSLVGSLVCLGATAANADVARRSDQSHDVTANPTCETGAGFGGEELTGCVQASPSGLTFTWTGYAHYSYVQQYVQFESGGTTTSQDITCAIPDCTRSFSLAPGEYSGWATLEINSGSAQRIDFDLVVGPSDPPIPQSISAPIVGIAATPDAGGYWEVGADGNVYPVGDAESFGSLVGTALNAPVVAMAVTPDGRGYWLAARDGGVFSFGDAQFYGSAGNIRLNRPVVGIAATPDGKGYWLVASDGGIFTFGDAPFYGSAGDLALRKPVVGMAADVDTGGYWLVAADGGIFSFNAPFYGSTGNLTLTQPIVGMEAANYGSGYRLVASDGGVFDFNSAFAGSLGGQTLPAPIVGMAPFGDSGYWLVGASASVSAFGGATIDSPGT